MSRIASPLVLLGLLLAACTDTGNTLAPPMDQFFFPTGVALTPAANGNSVMLVASSNYDLHYAQDDGATVLSVDPRMVEEGGSARAGGGPIVKLGQGARIGSFTGPLAIADSTNCPGLATPVALVASRLERNLHILPIGVDGQMDPCDGSACAYPLYQKLYDPFSVTVACRSDGLRHSAFVGYLRTPFTVAADGTAVSSGVGWVSEIDLDNPADPSNPSDTTLRNTYLAPGPVIAAAYDGGTDRLFAVGRAAGPTAPVFILNLQKCGASVPSTSCPPPVFASVDLFAAVRGADLSGIALSNVQPGLGRRAYVTARVYDADLAAGTGVRPSFDVAGVLMVLDLEDSFAGVPSLRLVNLVQVGVGPGQVTVLPVRPPDGATPRRDLVVLTNTAEGLLTVYDDDLGAVVRVFALDERTGQPQTGRSPFALAVEPKLLGTGLDQYARVYVGSFNQNMVSLVDVPMITPGATTFYTGPSGTVPYRIGMVGP